MVTLYEYIPTLPNLRTSFCWLPVFGDSPWALLTLLRGTLQWWIAIHIQNF